MRVVICDDDAGLRRVLGGLAALETHELVAETDHSAEAVDLVERFAADLLILDLSLGVGGGMDALERLRARDIPCEVVVFTAFAGERDAVLAAGARAVVEKPHFDELEAQVEQAASRRDGRSGATSRHRDRRRASEPRPAMPPAARLSPSGLEPRATFKAGIESLVPGDEILVLAVDGLEEIGTAGARGLVAADHRLAVGRLLRDTVRAQDRVSVDEDLNFVALLIGGLPEAAQRVFGRLDAAFEQLDIEGTLRAGWAARTATESPEVTVARAEGALVTNRDHRLDRLTQG